MKKIICLMVFCVILSSGTYATSRPLYNSKKVKSAQELIAWIKNENLDVFQNGEYRESISKLRENGDILVLKSNVSKIAVESEDGTMWYDSPLNLERVKVGIRLLDGKKGSLKGEKILEQFKACLPGCVFEEKMYQIELEDGFSVCVVYSRKVSETWTDKCIGFVKDNFMVMVTYENGVGFDFDTLKELSFELVSLAEPPETEFTDVQESDWFYEDVGRSIYIPGTTKTTFSPNAPADRVTIASALYNTKGELSYTGTPDFVDVDEDNPYATAIYWAQSCGIVNGVGDNKFNPNGNVTRQDFAVMLLRYMKYRKFNLPENLTPKTFADEEKIADYAKEAVYTLNTLGIMNGKGNNIIDPKGNVTRAEAAAMLHRMMNCFEK